MYVTETIQRDILSWDNRETLLKDIWEKFDLQERIDWDKAKKEYQNQSREYFYTTVCDKLKKGERAEIKATDCHKWEQTHAVLLTKFGNENLLVRVLVPNIEEGKPECVWVMYQTLESIIKDKPQLKLLIDWCQSLNLTDPQLAMRILVALAKVKK